MWQERVKSAAHLLGVEVARYRPAGARRVELMRSLNVAQVLDVGANIGQYGRELRRFGYEGSIISFEPVASAYRELARACENDAQWDCRRLALGESNGTFDIAVTSNTASASLLPMLHAHRVAAPDVQVVGTEAVDVTTLDSLGLSFDKPTMLKLDVQGYEDRVLRGARGSLPQIDLIECELSVVPLYESQLSMREMLDMLFDIRFELVALETGFRDARGNVVQFNGLVVRQGAGAAVRPNRSLNH